MSERSFLVENELDKLDKVDISRVFDTVLLRLTERCRRDERLRLVEKFRRKRKREIRKRNRLLDQLREILMRCASRGIHEFIERQRIRV